MNHSALLLLDEFEYGTIASPVTTEGPDGIEGSGHFSLLTDLEANS